MISWPSHNKIQQISKCKSMNNLTSNKNEVDKSKNKIKTKQKEKV